MYERYITQCAVCGMIFNVSYVEERDGEYLEWDEASSMERDEHYTQNLEQLTDQARQSLIVFCPFCGSNQIDPWYNEEE
jgi:hypothetical protein